MADTVQVIYEATPNPQSMKFIVGRTIAEESVFIDSVDAARRSPLAQKLFGFPWMAAVLIGSDFVTVTKQDWVGWDVLADPLCDLIGEHIESNEPVLLAADSLESESDDSDIVRSIKDILNNEIRPAVAMDGGDIIFHKYENDTLYLYMQGACSGCPSSAITLKQGIEARLKERIPGLKEVIAM